MKISIITPNYNYSKYIGQTIQSVIDQDYLDFEHIIVDDGSTDNSVQIIQEYVNKHPDKIKLIQQENKGQTKALNRALNLASGEIIGWINSDDYFNKDAFNKVISVFKKFDTIDAVYGNIGIIDKNGKLVKVNKYLKFSYISGVFNGFGKTISSNAIFWKKKLTDEVGFMNEDFVYSMDSEYWSRLLYKRKLKRIDYLIAYFRWHPQAKTIIKEDKGSTESIQANKERLFIMKNSYMNLRLSKVIPFKYCYPIYLFYRLKRNLKRGIKGHYLIFKR